MTAMNIETKKIGENVVHSHPTFALLSAKAITLKEPINLYGSQMKPTQVICIELHKAQTVITQNGEKHQPTDLIYRGFMTHAAFSEFVLKMNSGSVKITIDKILDDSQGCMGVPDIQKVADKHTVDIAFLDKFFKECEELKTLAINAKDTSGKKELRTVMEAYRAKLNELKANLPENNSVAQDKFNQLGVERMEKIRKTVDDKMLSVLSHDNTLKIT